MSSAIDDEDDEIIEEPTKQAPSSFDWDRFYRLFLSNKRIWKYIILYASIYFFVRKHCAPWYEKPSAQTFNDVIGSDQMVIEALVGHDSHKPASNTVILTDCAAHLLLLSGAKYRKAKFKDLIASINTKYRNNETDNHILDVHISVWTFLLIVDGIYCYRKRRFTKEDAMMALHHVGGLVTSSIFKYTQKGGLLWCWVGLYTEGLAFAAILGSLTRIYYQKRRPDLEWIKHFGDSTFAVYMFGFLYIRVYAMAKLMYLMIPKWCKDKSNHVLTKMWMVGIASSMVPLGWYWSFHTVRLVGEKIAELIKKNTSQ
eukprot:1106437_1